MARGGARHIKGKGVQGLHFNKDREGWLEKFREIEEMETSARKAMFLEEPEFKDLWVWGKGLTDLIYFSKYVLDYDRLDDKPDSLHKEMEKIFYEGEKYSLMIVPRGHYKTTVSIGYIVQCVVKDPNVRILLSSQTLDLVRKILSEIKGHFRNNEKLRRLYGDHVDPNNWTQDYITSRQRTKANKTPTIDVASITKDKSGQHYDIMVNDDLVSDKNSRTRHQVKQVIDWYQESLALLDDDSKYAQIIVIGTPRSHNDLYSHIKEELGEYYYIYERQAINDNWDEDSILLPSLHTLESLKEKRKHSEARYFALNYMCKPVAGIDQPFKPRFIQYYEHLPRKLTFVMACDLATGSQKSRACDTAIIVAGITKGERIYVAEASCGKFFPSQTMDEIFRLYLKYKPVEFGMEEAGQQAIMAYNLKNEMNKRNIYMPYRALSPGNERGKDDRITYALESRFRNKTIYFKKYGMEKLVDQTIKHPDPGGKKDLIDCLAYIPELASCVPSLTDGEVDWEADEEDAYAYTTLDPITAY